MAAKKTTKAKAQADKASKAAKAPKAKKAGPEAKPKKVSALDAAAKVLAEEGRPMNSKELIEAMGAKGYWTTPGGQTPWATLAIAREISTKKEASRFQKVEAGMGARGHGLSFRSGRSERRRAKGQTPAIARPARRQVVHTQAAHPSRSFYRAARRCRRRPPLTKRL